MGTIARGAKAGGGTDFNSGQTIDPAENNADHNTMYTEFNGNIENVNIKAAAAIATSKVAFSGARVTNSGDISLLTGTGTLMTYDGETFDTDTYHSTASNTGRLVAPTTGKYLITGTVRFSIEASGAAATRTLRIVLNGAGVFTGGTALAQVSHGYPAIGGVEDDQIQAVSLMTAADYVELFAYQDSGETLNSTAAFNVFTITRLGA